MASSLAPGVIIYACNEHGLDCPEFNSGNMKDSGKRKTFDSGMMRETSEGKPRYDLIWAPGLKKLAIHMELGGRKYSPRNWEIASSKEELERFREACFRHFMQWWQGEEDEDHLSATIFNLWGAENCRGNMSKLRETEE